jgi:hypothetical protein
MPLSFTIEYYMDLTFCRDSSGPICQDTVITKLKESTVGTITKSNREIIERGKFDTPNTQIQNGSLSCLGTDTSVQTLLR